MKKFFSIMMLTVAILSGVSGCSGYYFNEDVTVDLPHKH